MQRGFIGTIFVIIVGLAFLKYFFDWSIFDLTDSEQGRRTLEYVKDIVTAIWNFLKGLYESR